MCRFDPLESRAIAEQGLQNGDVQPVAAAMRAEEAEDPRAGQRQVADRIEHFVAHELIG